MASEISHSRLCCRDSASRAALRFKGTRKDFIKPYSFLAFNHDLMYNTRADQSKKQRSGQTYVIVRWLYSLLKACASIFFNILNLLLAGNLPPFGCVCIIVEEHERFLIIERSYGEYSFPGGFMRWHEHPIVAAQREGREETGLQLKILNLIGCSPVVRSSFFRMSTLSLIYRAEISGGELQGSIEGKPSWRNEAELREKLEPMQHGILEHYLAHRNDTCNKEC